MVAARSAGPATAATGATATGATATATLGDQVWLGHPLQCHPKKEQILNFATLLLQNRSRY